MRTNVCDTQSTTACYRDLTSWWVCNPFSSQTDNFLLVFTHPLNLLSEKNLSLSLAPFHLQLSLNKRFARLQSSNRAFDALLVPVTCIILLIRLLPIASSACAIAWRLMHSIILRWRRQVNTFLFRFFLFFFLVIRWKCNHPMHGSQFPPPPGPKWPAMWTAIRTVYEKLIISRRLHLSFWSNVFFFFAIKLNGNCLLKGTSWSNNSQNLPTYEGLLMRAAT